MIIKFNDSLTDLIKANNYHALDTLQQLADSCRYGNHYIIISNKLIKALKSSAIHRYHYQFYVSHYKTNSIEFSSVVDLVECYIEIFHNEYNPPIDTKAIPIDIKDVNADKIRREAILIAEHVDDCNFYSKNLVTVHTFPNKSISKLQVSFNYSNGGGSSVEAVFHDKINETTPLLCLVDSDKRHPDDKANASYSKCLNLNPPPYFKVLMLHCTEIENLVPDNLIEAFFLKNRKNHQNSVYKSVLKVNPEYKNFIDLKKEFNTGQHPYWQKLAIQTGINKVSFQCSGLIKFVLSELKSKSPQKIYEEFKNPDDNVKHLAKIIFSWGVASKPKRV